MDQTEMIHEHTAIIGEHTADIKNLKSWVSGIDGTLTNIASIAQSTAQTVKFQVKLGWVLITAIAGLVVAAIFKF